MTVEKFQRIFQCNDMLFPRTVNLINQAGKWDITRLPFPPQISGALAVGDYMRGRVKDLI